MLKIKKIPLKIKSKAGFTLVELLISIAIMGILVGIGGDIFATLIRAYRKAEMFSLAEAKGNTTLTLIEQDIRSAISVDVPDENNIDVFIPKSSDSGTIQRTYKFSVCTSDNENERGSISLKEGASATFNKLIDTSKTDLLGATLAIAKMKVSGSDVPFVVQTKQTSGDIQYDLITISFALNVGGTNPCTSPLVTSYFQTTVNLRGGLPY